MAAVEPTSLGGLHTLTDNPARVILTDNPREADALASLTPLNPRVWFPGLASDADLAALQGRQVVVWVSRPTSGYWLAGSATAWLRRLCAAAQEVMVVCAEDALGPAKFVPGPAVGDWLNERLVPAGQLLPNNVTPIKPPALAQAPANATLLAEDTLAHAFTAAYPNLRYVTAWGRWMEWDGKHWGADKLGAVMHYARMLCAHEADASVVQGATADMVRKAKKASTRSAIENMARSDPAHAMDDERWDQDSFALCTPGGMVDLRTGDIRPTRMEDYATKQTAATPQGQCPLWLRFLDEATGGNTEMQAYLQRVCGYLLTGDIREHAFFFVYGEGGNGKGTFLNTVKDVLGDYSVTTSMETWLEQRSKQHTTELAKLQGARMVSSQEIGEGKRWNEQRLREVTGGDEIEARFMRQDNFEFKPQFKLVMAANEKPSLRTVDAAIRRRLHLIPFETDFTGKPDKQLSEKLKAEFDGILLWMVRGCLEWQRIGLCAPGAVQAATAEYLEDQDVIKHWINDRCELGANLQDGVMSLYEDYKDWCRETSAPFTMIRNRFREKLAKRGFGDGRDRHGQYIKGIKRADSMTVNRGYRQDDIPGF